RAHQAPRDHHARSRSAVRLASRSGRGSCPSRARVLSPVRGCALAAPSPPTASFAPLIPRGGSPGHPRLAPTPPTGATPAPPRELIDSIRRQVESLIGIAARLGVRVTHVKAHGALYNQGERDATIARNIIFGVQAATGGHELVIVAPPGSAMVQQASGLGMKVASEGFVERAYEADGTMRSRSVAGSLLTDLALAVR